MLTTTAMTGNASNDVAPVLAANVLGTCHFFAQQFASRQRDGAGGRIGRMGNVTTII